MTNPTNYKISDGKDLAEVFQPLSLGSRIIGNTNYTIPNDSNGVTDLADVFAALDGRTPISFDTGYLYNSSDLRLIFADYNTPITTTVPFTLSPSNISYTTVIGNTKYYVITSVAGSSTITFDTAITNASIICVGGGGGGGGGNYTLVNVSFKAKYGGGGGGGGNACFTNVNFSSGSTYSISVGAGGAGGVVNSTSGGAGELTRITKNSVVQYSCSGGAGGTNALSSNTTPTTAGYVTVDNEIDNSTSNTGNGGTGGYYNINGSNSSSGGTPFTIPNDLNLIIAPSYSGGGAGGNNKTPLVSGVTKGGGGGAGASGIGGNVNNSSDNTGVSTTSSGSGGGGAGTHLTPGSFSGGGAGADGVLIIYFSYL